MLVWPLDCWISITVFVLGFQRWMYSTASSKRLRGMLFLPLPCNHHQAGLFRASIPRFNSSLPAQFPAMFIKIAGKCDIAFRTSNPNALSIRFSDGCMLLPAEWARFQQFAGLFVTVHASASLLSSFGSSPMALSCS